MVEVGGDAFERSRTGRRDIGATVVLGIAAVVVCSLVLGLNILQIHAFHIAKGSDQTYLYESLASTVHGAFFHQTHSITNLGGWGKMDHFWPVLLLFVPLAAVIRSVTVLSVINALCLTMAGIGVFALGRSLFKSRWLGVLAAVVFWTAPETYYFGITGNWPEVWAMPFLVGMFVFYVRRRPVAFSVVAVLFMACMEQMLAYVVLFAVLECLSRRDRLWLVLPVGLAVSWVGVLAVFAEGFAAGRFFTHRFDLSPDRMLTFARSLYVEPNRSPLLYLASFWPGFFLFAALPAGIVAGWGLRLELVPGNEGALRYSFFIFLFMMVGGLFGIRTLDSFFRKRYNLTGHRMVVVILGAVVVLHVAALVRMAPAESQRYHTDEHTAALWRAVHAVPDGARVVSNCVMSYLFVGRASAYVEMARLEGRGFKIWEFFFDDRNLPKDDWRAEDRFGAMGRHTPSAFILTSDGPGFRVVQGLWSESKNTFGLVRCRGADRPGGALIELTSPRDDAVLFQSGGTDAMEFEKVRGASGNIVKQGLDDVRTRETGSALPSSSGWSARLDDGRRSIIVDHRARRPAVTYRIGGHLEEILVTDLDQDGSDDLVAVDSARYRLWILRGRQDGIFENPESFAAPPIPGSVAACDLDADGDQELVVTKVQDIADEKAFMRFLRHEKIDHVFWDRTGGHPDIERSFEGNPGWVPRDYGRFVHFEKRNRGRQGPRDQALRSTPSGGS